MKTIQNSKIDLSSILLNTSFLLFSTLIITIITIIGTSPAHAESSSASANASVTVSDTITLTLTLTGGDLVINNLTPGTSADSNIITATVTSNSPYGFHLSATTGTKNGTTSLVNTADSNFSFTNLDSNKASLNDFSDNTWGYSYSTNDGTSWVSGDYGTALAGYNGLSLDNDDSGATGTTLLNSDSYTNSTAVKFKIGAKSSQTQASGTYTGTVNFYAVTNPKPIFYMQDMTTAKLNQLLPNKHSTITLYDKRDEQSYTVAKLKDGKYWMTKNLNLAGGTTLSPDDTDITSEYISSFSTSNNLIKDGNTIRLPASSTSGFSDANYSYVYNSDNETDCGAIGQNTPCYSYYSWDAVTLGSGRNIATDNVDAEQSICPKGWRLPRIRTTNDSDWQTENDFYVLAQQYGLSSGNTSGSRGQNEFYAEAGPGTIPGFLLTGRYNNNDQFGGNDTGFYWSSTSDMSNTYARTLRFNSTDIYTADTFSRRIGYGVRCLFGD